MTQRACAPKHLVIGRRDALKREPVSRSARSPLAGQSSLGVFKHAANSRVTPLKQGLSWPPFALSVKRPASARSNARFTRHRLALRAVRSARRSVSWSSDFAACSPEAIENAELLNTGGWGWGSPTVWQGDGGSDAFSRAAATEREPRDAPQRVIRAGSER